MSRWILGLLASTLLVSTGRTQDDCAVGERQLVDLDAEGEVLAGDRLVAFVVTEWNAGRDLNGDGDQYDQVFHIHDFIRNETRSLGLAADVGRSSRFRMLVDGRHVLVLASEQNNFQDFNGDDFIGHVATYFLYDADRQELRSLDLSVFEFTELDDAVFAEGIAGFPVEERCTGRDLDGDGEIAGGFIQILDLKRGTVRLNAHTVDSTNQGKRLFGMIQESRLLPPRDFNHDGDLTDYLPWTLDLSTNRLDVVPVIGSFSRTSTGLPTVFVWEGARGEDLNGDGDTDDLVQHLWDFERRRLTNLGRLGVAVHWYSDRRIYFQSERPGSACPNSELQYLDLDTRQFGCAGEPVGGLLSATPNFLLYQAQERFQGDLNGDGDQQDDMLVLVRIPSLERIVFPAGSRLELEAEDRLLYSISEPALGEDLNGDGIVRDAILHTYRFSDGLVTNLGVSQYARAFSLQGRCFLSIDEGRSGGDHDGDGLETFLLAELDPDTESLRYLGIAMSPAASSEGTLAWPVWEKTLGVDRNEDGDTEDRLIEVLQLFDLEWQARGTPRPGGKLFFEAKSVPGRAGEQGAVLISLGAGVDSGGVPLPGSNGLRLGLDADSLFSTWLTLPMPLRQVRLAGCQSIATAELPLPSDLPTGVRVYYAGYSFEGPVITAISGTRSFALQ